MKTLIAQESLARLIATTAHAGQFRRDGLTPYITHPEAVASRVTGDTDKSVAWLHDVLEDTNTTLADLYDSGLSDDVVGAVFVLTKRSPDYDYYLAAVKGNPVARRVKVADILHNLSDQPTDRQIVKYAKALLFLMQPHPALAVSASD